MNSYAAAVNGDALGGGFELALACDLRIVDSSARVGFPEVRLGLLPSAGGCVVAARLPSPIGAQLLMSGGLLDARTAEMYGLVTEVANLSDALRKTEDVLTRMVEMPAPALAAAKHLLAVLPTASDEEAFEIERKCVSALFRSDDTRRRITAFAERST